MKSHLIVLLTIFVVALGVSHVVIPHIDVTISSCILLLSTLTAFALDVAVFWLSELLRFLV